MTMGVFFSGLHFIFSWNGGILNEIEVNKTLCVQLLT
jgi:hypothetical protein